MATFVFFHAHPDDESISTGGTMARAAAEGHRVVLVTATDGAEGEVADGFLAEGETLAERRRTELDASAAILGVARVVRLGYGDSGMMGRPSNDDPACFWRADVETAGRRLADILAEEGADVVTLYDANGGYGHPDHIMVNRVGHAAARMAGTPRVFEATINRERLLALMATTVSEQETAPGGLDEAPDAEQLGTPEADITTVIDVTSHLEAKRAAMAAHGSQIAADSWFLALPTDLFATAFGTEWFVRTTPQPAPGVVENRLLP